MNSSVPPSAPPPPPPGRNLPPLARLWSVFRGLPLWVQVVVWVLFLPFVTALLIASTPEGSRVRYGIAAAVLVLGLAASIPSVADRAAEADLAAAAEAEASAESAEPEAAAKAAAEAAASEEPAAAVAATTWTVSNVVDGDTVDVRHADGTEERVRVIGIDTPERGECGFGEASSALAALVLNAEVELAAGARDDRDRYDRILRYLDVAGVDAGLSLIEDGLAIARYDSRDGYGRHDREVDHTCAATAESEPTSDPVPPPPLSSSGPGSGPSGAWKNCTEARDHGAAPVYRGDPGYGSHLDRDDDGIGCE